MALKNISGIIELDSPWAKVDLGDLNSFYLIGVKEAKGADDTIDPKDIKLLNFEVGIESGISNTYLTIGYLTLNFDEFTSNDPTVNSVTAMTRYLNYPSIFYIKPKDVVTYTNDKIVKGKASLSININTVKLK